MYGVFQVLEEVEVRSVSLALGTPSVPSPAEATHELEQGARSCQGCKVGGSSLFQVSPEEREP